MRTAILNADIVNEGSRETATVLIDGDTIADILPEGTPVAADTIVDGRGMLLLPGVIDDHVHFREPGLTHKADIASESAAAVAGGVTSFMDMPNTKPLTTTIDELDKKFQTAQENSLANYSFYIGVTADNMPEIEKADYTKVCGIKLFMGSSTGNMLVDNDTVLSRLFETAPALIAAHCEDEPTIRHNMEVYSQMYFGNIPWHCHAFIRSREACRRSSEKAAEQARRYNARLHLLHLTTADETQLPDSGPLETKKITGEACLCHLWFSAADYDHLGARIKVNPAIKCSADRRALQQAVSDGRIDIVATDHAPHTADEKSLPYMKAPSGTPMIQHSLVAMLDMAERGFWTYETVAERMCHAPAKLFGIERRGFIRKGYKADLVLVAKEPWTVTKDNIMYKCRWSAMEGTTFGHKVMQTYVNGRLAFDNGTINNAAKGEQLKFTR